MKKEQKIIWSLIIVIVLLIAGFVWLKNLTDSSNKALIPQKVNCIGQCNLNQDVCLDMLRVFKKGTYDSCSSEFDSCVRACLD